MSIMRCEIHQVFWDSDKLENCVLCDWVTHVDPIQLSSDHQADDQLACDEGPAQSSTLCTGIPDESAR